MATRIQSRRGNGRFRRNTLDNCFGLSCTWCPNPACGFGNPHKANEPVPTKCHACGQDLRPDAKIGYDVNGATLPTPECSEWVE